MMSDVIKEYSNDEITVVWQPGKCSHSALCAKSLSDVFNPKARPWVNMQGSNSELIVAAVKKCPSGALSIKGDTEQAEQVKCVQDTDSGVSIKVLENGPMLITGTVNMTMADKSHQELKNPALCRCGASLNKPFCDGSHARIDFKG